MARTTQTKKTPRRAHQRKAGTTKKNGKAEPDPNRVAIEPGLVSSIVVFLAGNGGDVAKQLTAAIQASPQIWVDEREVARARAEHAAKAAQAQLPTPDPE